MSSLHHELKVSKVILHLHSRVEFTIGISVQFIFDDSEIRRKKKRKRNSY